MELTLDKVEMVNGWLLCQRRSFARIEQSEGGIFIPDSSEEGTVDPVLWEVIKSGDNAIDEGGFVATDIYSGSEEIPIGGRKYAFVQSDQVRMNYKK